VLQFLLAGSCTFAGNPSVEHDAQNKRVTISDAALNLFLRLSYDGRCVLDQVSVGGRQVVSDESGVSSAIKIDGTWFSTRTGLVTPKVKATANSATVTGIRFGPPGMKVTETWRFTVHAGDIMWRIDRTYRNGGTLEDSCFPRWVFQNMSTWTGALLGDGGVAWTRLFDAPNASYGVHNGKATFWKDDLPTCLRIEPEPLDRSRIAMHFTRQPSGSFSLNCCVTEQELVPKNGLSRFRRDRQDIWRPFSVRPGKVSVQFSLSTPKSDKLYDRGTFTGLDGRSIRELCHTIARIGVVDEFILGSNGYYSDVAVLHEPWLAQMGLAIDDPDYCRAVSDTLDFQRQHAIGSDGRVKPRWSGRPGDEMRGTYDQFGYYECQWGWLMDSQTSWVINVAEQFDFTGDLTWLQREKGACEKVLDYLLRRDTDGNGLVKMMTDSHLEARGSDWIDVVWAAYENALVNAQAYWALSRWADCEELLGVTAQAARYRAAAARLKERFNRSTSAGGFWDAEHGCYAYWRNKDGSVHGTNLVVPVNFSAIGYGLCDEPARQSAILERMEALMQQEGLFFWPLCFFSYAEEEGHPKVNWPFPRYENGDLFLAWGELGTRAYAAQNPALALKYVTNVLAQYAKDGLAFQRYLRRSQTGEGKDILANNCSIIVGLYRNLYGIQPKYNRLYLEPHLATELNGTSLNYWLRGKTYHLDLRVNDYAASVDNFTVRTRHPFGVNSKTDVEPAASWHFSRDTRSHILEYFNGPSKACALSIALPMPAPLELTIQSWPEGLSGTRRWSESCRKRGMTSRHIVSGLTPNAIFRLSCDGRRLRTLRSDALGQVVFKYKFSDLAPRSFELVAAGSNKSGSLLGSRPTRGELQPAPARAPSAARRSSLAEREYIWLRQRVHAHCFDPLSRKSISQAPLLPASSDRAPPRPQP
jgi:hypothetical protein